jgi:hypothetical protein
MRLFLTGTTGATGPTGTVGLRGPVGATGVQPAAIPAPVTSLTVTTDTGVVLVNGATGAVTFTVPKAMGLISQIDITGLVGGVKAWGIWRMSYQSTLYGSNPWPGLGPNWPPDPANLRNYVFNTFPGANSYYGPQIGWGSAYNGSRYPDGYSYGTRTGGANSYTFPSTAGNSYSIGNLSSITYHGVGLFTINLGSGPNVAAGEGYPVLLVQNKDSGNNAVGPTTSGWAAINTEAGRGGDGRQHAVRVGLVARAYVLR